MRSRPVAKAALKGIASVALWIAAVSVTVLVTFAYALPQNMLRRNEPYATFVCISFFGRALTFHLGSILIILAAPALWMRRRRLIALCTGVALICLAPALHSYLPRLTSGAAASSGPHLRPLRILSMNLKYTQQNSELFTRQILNANADIVALQDYTPYAQQAIETATQNIYPYRETCLNFYQGLAIYSRIPFDEPPRTSITVTHRQMRVIIRFQGRPIVIYVEHPFSPRSKQRIISNRLATLDLAGEIQREIAREKRAVIAVGDFNFTENTPNEQALKVVGMKDAFECVGYGRGSTWPVEPRWKEILPGVRIDHAFFSPQLSCTAFSVGGYTGSDHLPIIVDIAIRD